MKRLLKKFETVLELALLFIITVPAFRVLVNKQYFTMHDDQHIARLYLLDEGVRNGILYPRWVDALGFGYGYPLFNFYPPFIYYVAELFRSVGFTYITSIKLMIVAGLVIGAAGIYILMKSLVQDRLAALVSSVFFTFFGYRAVTIYVRGAFAEFFALSLLPFLFWRLHRLYRETTVRNSVLFGITIALIVFTHPLIALPAALYCGFFFVFYLILHKGRNNFAALAVLGGLIGMMLSAFFWIPSFAERQFTLTDSILLTELAQYSIHFVYPQQLWYSPWGFGGSVEGLADGMSFQLGRIFVGFTVLSVITFILAFLKGTGKKIRESYLLYGFSIFLLIFSIFMTTSYSAILWDNIDYLAYLQFPWRFLTFVNIFIAIVCGYTIFFMRKLFTRSLVHWSVAIFMISIVVLVNTKYFRPQTFLNSTDKERTTYQEIAWRISRTSFEFIPKGVKITKSDINTTIPDIREENIPRSRFTILGGTAQVREASHRFNYREFYTSSVEPIEFQLNTFNFPGWEATINGEPTTIRDNNDLKLITVDIPSGEHRIEFFFNDTYPRKLGWGLTVITVFVVFAYLFFPERKVRKQQ